MSTTVSRAGRKSSDAAAVSHSFAASSCVDDVPAEWLGFALGACCANASAMQPMLWKICSTAAQDHGGQQPPKAFIHPRDSWDSYDSPPRMRPSFSLTSATSWCVDRGTRVFTTTMLSVGTGSKGVMENGFFTWENPALATEHCPSPTKL
eukprot:scaffold520_cov224-Pinguiococcus_pyrenoidosus.AAC.10